MSADGLPPNLLALFAPRKPIDPLPVKKCRAPQPLDGLCFTLECFEDTEPPPSVVFETPKERSVRQKVEKQKNYETKLKKLIQEYKPRNDIKSTRDPFCTLFIGRLSYETTEKKLKKEFEQFGIIRKLRMVSDHGGKPRGYAFIEFEHEYSMKEAYKKADGKKIDGRRVVVDVERGRTVEGWLPRRLGGGRGPPRYKAPKQKGVLPPVTPVTSGTISASRLSKAYEYDPRAVPPAVPLVTVGSLSQAASALESTSRHPTSETTRNRDRSPPRERERDRERRRHSRSRSRSRGRSRRERR